MRIKLSDVMASRIPQVLGMCATNVNGVASYINEAQQRLINAGSQTGWWNGWARVVVNVSRENPYFTLPPDFARAAGIDVCRTPIRIQNDWYEVLVDGVGLQTECAGRNGCGALAAYDRGSFSTAVDLPSTNQYLRIYPTSAADIGKRILFSGAMDANNVGIYSADGLNSVDGFYLTLQSPFTTSAFVVTSFSALSKVVTKGDVVLKAVDATTGVETFLSRYTPQETNPAYRRYYLHSLPCNCCHDPALPPSTAQLTALLKYEYRPATQPSDFLLISNIPALKAECESIRYAEMDVANGQQFSILKHREAIKLLSQELEHYEGPQDVAINVRPTGVIGLRELRVGSMM